VHSDCRRSERVIRREDQSTPVLAIMIRSLWWSCEYVMPLEDVGLGGVRDDEWRRVFGYRLVLAG